MPYDTIEYRGCTIQVDFDSDPMSPFEWDPSPVFISWNDRYHGDVGNKSRRWSSRPEDLIDQIYANPDVYAYAVRAYIHSGITVSLGPRIKNPETVAKDLHEFQQGYPYNDSWDSGWFGVLIFTKKQIEDCYGPAEQYADQAAKNFVNSWDNYLTGQIFWYKTETPNGEEISSCGGFENKEDMIEEAKAEIDSWFKEQVPLFLDFAKDMIVKKVEDETSL